MKTIEEQIDARKKLTKKLHEYVSEANPKLRRQHMLNLQEGIRMYESRFGESWRPYYEPK